MAWRDTVDYYVSLSFAHMVGDSCWGHHCWSLILAQPTGHTLTHTNTHIQTGLSLIFFHCLRGLSVDLRSFHGDLSNTLTKNQVRPQKISGFGGMVSTPKP